MDEVLYKSLDAATRRRYDANLLKHELQQEHERQVHRQEKDDFETAVRWFFLYAALCLLVLFFLLAVVYQSADYVMYGLILPFFVAFIGLIFTLY